MTIRATMKRGLDDALIQSVASLFVVLCDEIGSGPTAAATKFSIGLHGVLESYETASRIIDELPIEGEN